MSLTELLFLDKGRFKWLYMALWYKMDKQKATYIHWYEYSNDFDAQSDFGKSLSQKSTHLDHSYALVLWLLVNFKLNSSFMFQLMVCVAEFVIKMVMKDCVKAILILESQRNAIMVRCAIMQKVNISLQLQIASITWIQSTSTSFLSKPILWRSSVWIIPKTWIVTQKQPGSTFLDHCTFLHNYRVHLHWIR